MTASPPDRRTRLIQQWQHTSKASFKTSSEPFTVAIASPSAEILRRVKGRSRRCYHPGATSKPIWWLTRFWRHISRCTCTSSEYPPPPPTPAISFQPMPKMRLSDDNSYLCMAPPLSIPSTVSMPTTPFPSSLKPTSDCPSSLIMTIRKNNRKKIHRNPIQILISDPLPSSHPDRPLCPPPCPSYQ